MAYTLLTRIHGKDQQVLLFEFLQLCLIKIFLIYKNVNFRIILLLPHVYLGVRFSVHHRTNEFLTAMEVEGF